MSVSSAHTLISPSTTSHTSMQRSNSHGPGHTHGHKARTASHHHHGHAHHGHAKRRPSAHAAHTTGHLGTGRRGSEGDGGRKAIFQGLTMATVDGNGKKKEERPGPKSSKSDSNVLNLKLRRTTSGTSNTSSQHGKSKSRPGMKEKDSESSVVVVDDDGQEVEVEEGEAEDEEWDDEDTPPKAKADQDDEVEEEEEEEEEDESDKDLMSQAMRRTMSASIATVKTQSPEEMTIKPASITSPVSTTSRPEAPVLTTRKTTGFGGKHPEPSPEPEPEPLRRVQSVKELAAEVLGSERKATAQKLAMMTDQSSNGPSRQGSGPSRTRSTDGSGIPNEKLAQIETSPSYPFPRVLDAGLERTTSNGLRQSSNSSTPQEKKPSNGLRHVSSNTSIRSTVSYRAPPHPLNSSLGHARTASTALSTDMDMRRSMHQPPLAPPVIYRVAAEGHTWDLLEPPEADTPAPAPMSRRESSSSQRSLRAIFQPTSSRMAPTQTQRSASGPGPSQNGPIPNRRPTAMEAASAASKMHTTTNAALYHQSLGYSTSQAETAHLISRFLPAKPHKKAPWILTADSEAGQKGITESEYKPAHDSLCRMMKSVGIPKNPRNRNGNQTGSGFRKASRFTSNLLTVPVGIGIIKSKNGPLRIERGGWGGKTPIELSVARCQAQRPRPVGR